MLNRSSNIIEELRAANPVSVNAAQEKRRGAFRLEAKVKNAVTLHERSGRRRLPIRPQTRRQRRVRLTFGVIALLAAAIAALPAFGLRLSSLPFFQAEKAPQSVQLDFAQLGVGAPPGMDPRAIAGETRKIESASFGGSQHTLWVAPTEKGGFCYLWTPGYGGCNASGAPELDAIGEMATPLGVTAPTVSADATDSEIAAAMRAWHDLATIPVWVAGFVNVKGAQAIAIRFKDGIVVHPAVTWVSEPIGAGFFVYDAPSDKRMAATHIVAVDALSAGGTVVKEQILSSDR